MGTSRAAIAAALVAASLVLSACVTGSQPELAQAVRDLRTALDGVFNELDKLSGEPPQVPAASVSRMIEVGSHAWHEPDSTDIPSWLVAQIGAPPSAPEIEPEPPLPGPMPVEPKAGATEAELATYAAALAQWEAADAALADWEIRRDAANEAWEAETAVWELLRAAAIASWAASQSYRAYDAWGLSATLDGQPLFEAVLIGKGARRGSLCPSSGPGAQIECVPSDWTGHEIDAAVKGLPTGSNPTTGTATWRGRTRGLVENGQPAEGHALLAADLAAGSIDAYLSLGQEDFAWRGLVMDAGRFARVDEAETPGVSLGSSINGAFYGPNHEGAAGKFQHHRSVGVFGALRETD